MEAKALVLTLRERWRNLSRPTVLAIILTVLTLFFSIFLFSWNHCFFGTCPDVKTLTAYQPGGAPVLLDRNGELFADLTPVEHATVPLYSLPSHVAQAFLAVEDQRFLQHNGVDWRRVGGAFMADLRAGSFQQGFSTITMQLARNLFPERIPGQEQSLARKLIEVRVAREIERRFSKQEILELYLNHIYFGNRAHGIEAAARQYFGRPATQLTIPQAALLAGLPKAPSHYDPRRRPREALERRNLVLTLMERQRRIPRREAERAREEPLGLAAPPRQARTEAGLAPWFVEQVRRDLEEHFGADLYTQALRVRTTLDSRAQRTSEEELARQLKQVEGGQLGGFDGPRYDAAANPSPDGTAYLQGAVVVLDPRNGDVLAWVGGRNFAHSQFDRASQARRQAGSAFKPFVYAAALRAGWVLSQPLIDRPLSVRLPTGQVWRPKNFTGNYEGQVTLRDALVRSKNVPTVRLASAVGLGEVAAAAHRAGIDEPLPELPSIALGTVAVSPLELTTAYTPFASLGSGVEPRFILAVEDEDGKVLWKPEARRREILDPRVAFLITDVLGEALERGTGIGALREGLKVPAAGKTGTTNDGADAWFVGYTPEMVGGVWIGFDKPRPILADATGGRLAAPVWGRLMQRVYTGRKPPLPWARPNGVVERAVDPGSGLLLAEGCAAGAPTRELFLADAQPKAWCPGHGPRPRDGFPVVQRADEERAEQIARAEAEAEEKARRLDEERKRKEEKEGAERIAREQQEKKRELEARQAKLEEEERRIAEREAAAEREAKLDAKKAKEAKEKAATKRAAREKAAQREEERIARAERERDLATRRSRLEAEERRIAEREASLRREERKQKRAETRRARTPDPESSDASEDAGEEEERTRPEPVDDIEVRRRAPEADEPEESGTDVSGWWELSNRIDETNYESYLGLRLGYRLQLEQDGDRITGRGQKWSEDGRSLPGGARTPLTVRGRIEGRTVTLEFTEHGARRSTAGGFTWRLAPDDSILRGSFWSTAAGTRGRSTARRMR
jgi:penicillin-binding protein 1A